jgi:hypothetical protein
MTTPASVSPIHLATKPIRAGSFAPMAADEFLSTPPPPLAWVWDRLIPTGSLTVFAAYMKVGKSTLTYPLVVAVAQGRPFLGFPTKRVPVLILAVEEHQRDVRLRLDRCGLKSDDPVYIHVGRLSPGEFPKVVEFIREKNVGLVLLDTLSRYWNITDENDNAEVARLLDLFLELARSTDVAVVLVHHDRKAGGEDGRNLRGGSALFGVVDQAIHLTKRKGGTKTQRLLKTLGRYAESPPELALDYDPAVGYWLADHLAADREQQADKILEALKRGPLTLEELGEATGLPRTTLQDRLEELVPGRVKRTGTGKRGQPYRFELDLNGNRFCRLEEYIRQNEICRGGQAPETRLDSLLSRWRRGESPVGAAPPIRLCRSIFLIAAETNVPLCQHLVDHPAGYVLKSELAADLLPCLRQAEVASPFVSASISWES